MAQPPLDDLGNLWESVLRAVGTEPRPAREIQGISGVIHRPLALGVDDASKRLVVITDEPTPRHAAMMQIDIAATLPDVRVSVARVIPIDLATVAARTLEQFGGFGALMAEFQAAQQSASPEDKGNEVAARIGAMKFLGNNIDLLKRIPVGWLNAVLQAIDQLRLIEVAGAIQAMKGVGDDASVFFENLRLDKLAQTDIIAPDREVGVCPVLIPSFSEAEIDILLKPRALEDAREILKAKRIYQYFFPGLDDLALGLVDRGVRQAATVAEMVSRAPDLGHPYGENEVVGPTSDPMAVIDELKRRGLTIEGEFGWELGPDGEARRMTLKFKPSEGVTTKILNRCNINVNLNADAATAAAIVTKLTS